ncbi:major type 1 subunit fimbrin (pilin) [Klebsiella oxytoca]|uniref:Major type 1 subunit fimbrin (Pilin) n=1 Tax=Klebsiella oxytoca TaxID=571 RepID=A0A318FLD4_KLEOX|nr:fimbrial protein [Klebsiella oxytoca]PXW42822.1 major type 1 subunit fimbrin (pilin) [Klebsiella oxytoca]
MKLNHIFASVVAASAMLSTGAMAADGTITFAGTVTASACTAVAGVSVGGGAPAVNQTITLPAVPAPALNVASGTYLGHTAFQIQLTGCAAVGALANVRAVFDTPFAPAGDAYVAGNTAPSGAADVAVAILTSGGTQIDMNGGTSLATSYTLPSTSGAINMDFVAAYKSLSTSVTAGPVAGTANYTISYF